MAVENDAVECVTCLAPRSYVLDDAVQGLSDRRKGHLGTGWPIAIAHPELVDGEGRMSLADGKSIYE